MGLEGVGFEELDSSDSEKMGFVLRSKSKIF